MRIRTTALLVTAATATALLLTGCQPTEIGSGPLVPVPVKTPTASASASATAAAPSTTPPASPDATASPAQPSASATPTKSSPPRSAAVRTARKQLATLTVAEADYSVAYNRTRDFGTAWKDVDGNGCDTRNDILRRDLTQITYRSDDPGCTVATGVLNDPYTGEKISFVRGPQSAKIQIDHLFPLHYVALHGAEQWSQAKREAYANDPEVLLAVDGPANGQKSDSGPADWLPSNTAYRCTYAEKLVQVAADYKFTISRRDDTALGRILADCK